jgi:predicted ATP-dependent endonuclease of OLD family
MKQNMRLQSVRIRNFKAIVDSKTVKLGALTVFIGEDRTHAIKVMTATDTDFNKLRSSPSFARFEDKLVCLTS